MGRGKAGKEGGEEACKVSTRATAVILTTYHLAGTCPRGQWGWGCEGTGMGECGEREGGEGGW